MSRRFIVWGSILMALSVAIGAFGAHMLKDKITPDELAIYETGVHYHMIHGLAVLIAGIVAKVLGESRKLFWAGTLFIAGTVIFSGSLYVLSISGIKWLGAITPIGGVSFIVGWLMLMSSALSRKNA
ncbi:DUF423 domain-containing protein [Paenibacillus lautus]|uniref:DUF423 domain-containing protein n=1 Tax=Paenibacillus TaxID=44249 RepID=UPI003692965B